MGENADTKKRLANDKDVSRWRACHDCHVRRCRASEWSVLKVMNVLSGDSRCRRIVSALLFHQDRDFHLDGLLLAMLFCRTVTDIIKH